MGFLSPSPAALPPFYQPGSPFASTPSAAGPPGNHLSPGRRPLGPAWFSALVRTADPSPPSPSPRPWPRRSARSATTCRATAPPHPAAPPPPPAAAVTPPPV